MPVSDDDAWMPTRATPTCVWLERALCCCCDAADCRQRHLLDLRLGALQHSHELLQQLLHVGQDVKGL